VQGLVDPEDQLALILLRRIAAKLGVPPYQSKGERADCAKFCNEVRGDRLDLAFNSDSIEGGCRRG
jgi:hypothetical protein